LGNVYPRFTPAVGVREGVLAVDSGTLRKDCRSREKAAKPQPEREFSGPQIRSTKPKVTGSNPVGRAHRASAHAGFLACPAAQFNWFRRWLRALTRAGPCCPEIHNRVNPSGSTTRFEASREPGSIIAFRWAMAPGRHRKRSPGELHQGSPIVSAHWKWAEPDPEPDVALTHEPRRSRLRTRGRGRGSQRTATDRRGRRPPCSPGSSTRRAARAR
jgi:hypothetical protein